MYHYYKKGKRYIMEYSFDSLTEFIEYLDQTPINSKIWGNNSLESSDNNYNFRKTWSLEEAKELCKYGYHENFNKLLNLKNSLEKYIKLSVKKSRPYNFYVGYAPDVKAYLEGNPLSMFYNQNPKRKHIDIYYNSSVMGKATTEQIYNRGAITLCLVEILETMGFTVGLNVFTMSEKGEQIHYAKFNIKQLGERINIQKLYFPLCHPSFLRRLVFRLREETPDISAAWTDNYGKTCDDFTVREIIDLKDNDIVICQPSEMNVLGEDIINDANAMFDYINKFTSDEIEFAHVKRLQR